MPFHYASSQTNPNTLIIDNEEAHHLIRVLRVHVGDILKVVSPSGKLLEGIVTDVSKTEVLIEKKNDLPTPPPPYPIHLFLALIKPEKIEWVIEKATELNMASLTLIKTDHSNKDSISDNKWQRFKKITAESQKQCERIVPLQLNPIKNFDKIDSSEFLNLFCIERENCSSIKDTLTKKNEQPLAVYIGPEGGWSEKEILSAQERNFQFVTLGPLVLRAETAALHAISSILAITQ